MNTPKDRGVIALGLLALILAITCGCHGRSGNAPGAAIMSQTSVAPPIQAKQQAQLNNPRVSPLMKQMLRQHLQQTH